MQHQLEHVQHLRVLHPLCHLRQEEVLPDIVKVRLPIHVTDAGLVLHNRLCYAQDCLMCRALRAIAVCPRLAIRFKDRFQNELAGSLDHTVTDRRHREATHLGPALLRDGLVPQPHGAIRAGDQFVLEWLEEYLDPLGLDGLKRHPINPWSAVVLFGQSICFAARVQLADMDVQAPETPGRFSLRLGVYPPAQVLQTDGCLCHRTPASHVVEGVTHSRVPSFHGHYPASPLLRTPPPPSHLQSISRGTGYTTSLAPPVSRWDEEGFSSCLACPCAPAVAPTPPEWSAASASVRRPMLPAPFRLQARPLGLLTFGATCAFACATAWKLATIPQMVWSRGFRKLVSRPPALRATGLWLFPWEVSLLLNTLAFPGHTPGQDPFSVIRLKPSAVE